MSLPLMLSRTLFAVTVIALFAIIAFLWLFNLPDAVKTLLWYLTFVVLFLAVISWVAYRHQKAKDEAAGRDEGTRAEFTPDGEEPAIGKTYRFKKD